MEREIDAARRPEPPADLASRDPEAVALAVLIVGGALLLTWGL